MQEEKETSRVKGTIQRSLTKKTTAKAPKKTATTTKKRTTKKTGTTVSFEFYAPLASVLGVAGSFNGWDATQCPLTPVGDGYWSGTTVLQTGHYQYKYVIDNTYWELAQGDVPRAEDAQGQWNNVLCIE